MKKENMILEKIRNEMNGMSARQKAIGLYLLKEYENAAFMTVAQLAEASGVSDASVVRFATRLGYAKYSDLRDELRNILRSEVLQTDRFRHSGTAKSYSTMMKTVEKSMRTDMRSIEKTLDGLREEDVQTVVNRLSRAARVFVTGSHTEYGIACYFASQLNWIRGGVYLLDGTHEPDFDSMSSVNERDVLFAMSFPPYPAQTVMFLKAAKKRHAFCIAVTDSPLSPLAKRADCSLYANDVKLFFADNSAPTMSLLSIILGLVGNDDYEKSMKRLEMNQRYWDDIGFYFHEP